MVLDLGTVTVAVSIVVAVRIVSVSVGVVRVAVVVAVVVVAVITFVVGRCHSTDRWYMSLKPFWRYYGGKWRAAPRYPKPQYSTIIEPFAGAAGYSMRYPELNVILVERYAVVAEIWRYLIAVRPYEIRRIPCVDNVEDLPAWVPQGARWLIGFCMNSATVSPCRRLSAGSIKLRAMGGYNYEGWTKARRERVASQVEKIRHWKIIEGDYAATPNATATWFIDPPYNNRAGSYYIHSQINYHDLSGWCRSRNGQVIVCENAGADWLPFKPFAICKAAMGRQSHEAIWTND